MERSCRPFYSIRTVKSVGITGASICVVGGFIIVLTLLIDLDYKVTWAKIRDAVAVWMEWLKEKQESWKVRRDAKQKDVEAKQATTTVRIKKPAEELTEPVAQVKTLPTPVNPVIKPADVTTPNEGIVADRCPGERAVERFYALY